MKCQVVRVDHLLSEAQQLIFQRLTNTTYDPSKRNEVLYSMNYDPIASRDDIESVFVVGGENVAADNISAVHVIGKGDAWIDEHDKDFVVWSASKECVTYVTRTAVDEAVESLPRCTPPHPESQYLDLVARVLQDGVARPDRTDTGTLSLFGAQLRFDLGRNFPLLTTKRVFWKAVVEELLWFISGSTDATRLAAKGVHIWDGNGSRAFLDAAGMTQRRVGDLGPVYGFQWRHFGATYTACDADYTGQGIDQLSNVIKQIRDDPNDRRIILSAWNPSALPEMALQPCHMFCQFYVAEGKVSCHMYQRSCDLGLGVPFNIASYALLTCMIAHVTGLRPGEFVHSLGDAHVYSNHVAPLKTQLLRQPRPFPRIKLNPKVQGIDNFSFEDIVLEGYNPHSKIDMVMAV